MFQLLVCPVPGYVYDGNRASKMSLETPEMFGKYLGDAQLLHVVFYLISFQKALLLILKQEFAMSKNIKFS